MNIDELFDNYLLTSIILGISKKLGSRKNKSVATTTSTRNRYDSPKAWRKEVPRSNKRKLRVNATSDDDVDVNAQNIV